MEGAADERPLIPHLPSQDEEGSLYTSDGTVDVNNQPALKRTTGNWRACFLILGTEFVECFVFFGVAKNLVTFLTGELHESNVDAAKNVSTWIGTCFFTPVIGAFLADTYWGKYWTLVIFLSIYTIGMLTLTVSASLPLLMGTIHNNGIRHFTVYLGLYLVALGEGGIKPCTSALGADQFDGADPVEKVTKASFFNWYKKLEGSPLKRVTQVVVAAVRNYNLGLPADCSALHEVPSPTRPNCKIQHTPQFRFFDKAAIVAASSDEKGVEVSKNPWRLCTVSQVEELKMLLRMFPVWASMVLFFTVTAQMSSTFIEQGAMMDNRVGPFTVPPASLATFDVISVMVCIPVYDAALVPLARRATGKERGLSQLQRLGVGLALSVVAMVYAALVEARRLSLARSAAARQPTMTSIMWQAPAFALLGAGEVFTAIGILEFFYDQSPGGMKSLGTALAQLTIAAGNYLNSAVLGAVAALTTRGGKPGWIPDDLNEGHLDYFFWLMAALGVVNLLHFVHCSMRYRGNNNNTAL
ncbi:protein NRT1/ PTR FAMILY 8.3-like isoform X2 [Panicum virgatum]|uniref:protein NRT1/ PTR FAMILY 8.3-like isoform X2 n=1 Tax=Panicum virgatum TaxID=38727 RepID=UPI0019D5575C|nr:protein NRT1/ PTR FAMILY 8.3-like isoform X2 [Panicum virgatum]